jgi:hypothetical protein
VARCAACCEIVAALAGHGDVGAATIAPRRRETRFRPVLAAASVLLLIGLAIGGYQLASRVKEPAARFTFESFTVEELDRLGRDVVRSNAGVRPVFPARKILETRPAFRLATGPDAKAGEIVVTAAGSGAEVLRIPFLPGGGAETRVDLPPTAPGLETGAAYVWEAGGEVARFEVASDTERAAFEKRSAAMAGGSLVKSQLALQMEFLGEAERHAREAVAAAPEDPLARATLAAVRRLLGIGEE